MGCTSLVHCSPARTRITTGKSLIKRPIFDPQGHRLAKTLSYHGKLTLLTLLVFALCNGYHACLTHRRSWGEAPEKPHTKLWDELRIWMFFLKASLNRWVMLLLCLGPQTTRLCCSSCKTRRFPQEIPFMYESICLCLLETPGIWPCPATTSCMWLIQNLMEPRTLGLPVKFTPAGSWTSRVELYQIITGRYTTSKRLGEGPEIWALGYQTSSLMGMDFLWFFSEPKYSWSRPLRTWAFKQRSLWRSEESNVPKKYLCPKCHCLHNTLIGFCPIVWAQCFPTWRENCEDC